MSPVGDPVSNLFEPQAMLANDQFVFSVLVYALSNRSWRALFLFDHQLRQCRDLAASHWCNAVLVKLGRYFGFPKVCNSELPLPGQSSPSRTSFLLPLKLIAPRACQLINLSETPHLARNALSLQLELRSARALVSTISLLLACDSVLNDLRRDQLLLVAISNPRSNSLHQVAAFFNLSNPSPSVETGPAGRSGLRFTSSPGKSAGTRPRFKLGRKRGSS